MTGTTPILQGEATSDYSPTSWEWPNRRPWALFVLTALLYAVGSLVALLVQRDSGLSGAFFIPAGVTVAFLLRTERRRWWLVIVGAIVAEVGMDLAWGFQPGETAFYAIGNSLEPLLGAAIVSANVRAVDLRRVAHLGWWVAGAVLAGPAVGAAIGAVGSSVLAGGDFARVFPQWWLGDALGVVIVGGLILTLNTTPSGATLASLRGAGLLIGLIALTTAVLSQSNLDYLFTVLIGIVIAGTAFGSHTVAVTAVVISATIAVYRLLSDTPLASAMLPEKALMLLKMNLGTFTLAGFLVAAQQADTALAERRRGRDQATAIRLQEGLLPRLDLEYDQVEIAARYEAATDHMIAGGDWYDAYPLPDGRIGLTVGDVIGHGPDAAASMGRLRTAMAVLAPLTRDPGELLSRLHTVVSGPNGTRYATALCATLDPKTGTLDHASAGHPPMLMVAPGMEPTWVSGGLSAPLSGPPEGRRVHETIQLPEEATLVLYSDGLVERRGDTIQSGLDILRDALTAARDGTAVEICNGIFEAMEVDANPHDDVVVMVVKRRARAKAAH